MPTFKERALTTLKYADSEEERNAAWFLLAQAAILALIAIATELEALPKER